MTRLYADAYDDIIWSDFFGRQIGSWNMVNGAFASWTLAGTYEAPWYFLGFDNFIGGTGSATDVIFRDANTGQVGVWEMENGLPVSWTVLGYAGTDWQHFTRSSQGHSDLTGDGYEDIIWENSITGEVGFWDVFNGTAAWQSLGYAGSGWYLAGQGDVVGNGNDDIIWLDGTTGSVGVWDMSSGTAQWTYLGSTGGGWDIRGVADLTGDGYDDILWSNFATQEVGIWDGSATGFEWRSLGHFDLANWSILGIGDYSGDGQNDLLWLSADAINQVVTGHTGYTDLSGGDSLTQTWVYLGYTGTDWIPS